MLPKLEKFAKGDTFKESEGTRLGRDTEKLIEKLEHEKRESEYLDQQISLMQDELTQIKADNKLIFPGGGKENKLKNKCLALEKKIELEVIHLNEVKSRSRYLKNQVNSFRKDKKLFKSILQNLKEDIKDLSNTTNQQKLVYENSIELQNKYKKKINSLRGKSLVDKNEFSDRFNDISSLIQEKANIKKNIYKQIEDEILGQIKRQPDAIEITKLQKSLLGKWVLKVKDQKKALDNYSKNLNVLKETFYQIRIATGMHSVSDIVVSVIKSEEQNSAVYSYLNILNTEIDQINKAYIKTSEEIESLSKGFCLRADDQPDQLKKAVSAKQAEQDKYKSKFNQVQSLLPLLKSIYNTCLDSGLPIPAPKEDYLEIDSIEYDQISNFLGTVETYLKTAAVFVKSLENKFGEIAKEKNRVKDIELKDFFEVDFDENRAPMSLAEFQQRSLSFLSK